MKSIAGQRSGMLEAIERVERPTDYTGQIKGTWWRCRCDCGREKIVPRQYIAGKTIRSCGCLKRGGTARAVKPKKTEAEIRADKARAGRIRAEQLRGRVTNFRMPSKQEQLDKEDRKMLDIIAKKCKCAWCGKAFERLSPQWTYKDVGGGGRVRWYCSYTCWRAVDKKAPKQMGGVKREPEVPRANG